jgi:hypothetical protein
VEFIQTHGSAQGNGLSTHDRFSGKEIIRRISGALYFWPLGAFVIQKTALRSQFTRNGVAEIARPGGIYGVSSPGSFKG